VANRVIDSTTSVVQSYLYSSMMNHWRGISQKTQAVNLQNEKGIQLLYATAAYYAGWSEENVEVTGQVRSECAWGKKLKVELQI